MPLELPFTSQSLLVSETPARITSCEFPILVAIASRSLPIDTDFKVVGKLWYPGTCF